MKQISNAELERLRAEGKVVQPRKALTDIERKLAERSEAARQKSAESQSMEILAALRQQGQAQIDIATQIKGVLESSAMKPEMPPASPPSFPPPPTYRCEVTRDKNNLIQTVILRPIQEI